MSDHTQLLHDIEAQLEKLANAHTVLSNAIEHEKQAGLVTAMVSAEKTLAPHIAKAKAFAKPATDRIAAATTNEKRVAGGVALAGAFGAGRVTAGSGQNKQASDQDQDNYSPHYIRNAVLAGGALATPDMARAYSSTAQGLDHRETFHEHSAMYKKYLAEGDLINAAKYADSANTHKALAHQAELYTHNLGGSIGKRFAAGAALATAATGVNHIMHSGQTKSASLKAILQALETC